MEGWRICPANFLSNRSVKKYSLIDIVLKMSSLLSESKNVLRSAMEHFDEPKSELVKIKADVIDLQRNLLACKEDKLVTVQETVKSEIMSFGDVVKKNCSPSRSSVTPENLKKVIKYVLLMMSGKETS